ncbi:MAG: tRNA 2-selenouridine(34) synthase MnmH [Mariniblastus sp.]|nr:tRNA 2-selenouridine(34) synthase MnmH [Mariniblastus sp.]
MKFFETISAAEFWQLSKSHIVFDVRSPVEFAEGHIPGAINLPMFDDQQRAEVGTLYKHSGRDAAVLRGLKIAGLKMADLVVQATQAAQVAGGSKQVLVHCWRGGMRSQSIGWLLATAGLEPTVLEGGYKSFRRLAHDQFEIPWRLQVVSGLTGAGKTRVLRMLEAAGEQVLDLEGVANHRGSAFGGIGQEVQPTTEQFSNELFARLSTFSSGRTVWIEDEGHNVGSVVVPAPLYQRLRHSPGIIFETTTEHRIANLLEDYGDLPAEQLVESVERIRKRLGPQNALAATAAIESGNVKQAIELVLGYYDKFYIKATQNMPRPAMPTVMMSGLTDQEIVASAIEASQVTS